MFYFLITVDRKKGDSSGRKGEGGTFHPKGTFLGPAPVLLVEPGPDAWNRTKGREIEGVGEEAGKASTHR